MPPTARVENLSVASDHGRRARENNATPGSDFTGKYHNDLRQTLHRTCQRGSPPRHTRTTVPRSSERVAADGTRPLAELEGDQDFLEGSAEVQVHGPGERVKPGPEAEEVAG
jgi:hypothetical protein